MLFTKEMYFHKFANNGIKVTFTNCKFINISGFAIIFQPNGAGDEDIDATASQPSEITISDCEFINCNRGIHISDREYTTINISDCKFSLKTGETPYNCIQISGYDNDTELKSLKINFTNNTVASANGVVYFHDEMTGPQSIDSFKAVFGTFSGNTYAQSVVKIADRGEYEEGHVLYNNTTAMEELATYVK